MESFRQLGRLPRDLWVICACILVNRCGQMALPFLMLYLTTVRGMAPSQAGDVFIAYGIASLAMAPIAGRLSDRFGAARIMCASQATTAVALFTIPFLESRAALFAGVVFWAVCAELFRPASLTATANLAPQDLRAPAFALARVAINLGLSFGALIGGRIADVRFDVIFFVNATTCCLAAIVLLPLVRRHAAAARAAAAAEPVATPEPPAAQSREFARRMLLLCTSSLCIALIFFQFDSTMPLFMTRDLGLANRRFGELLAVNTILIVLIEVPLNAKIAHWPLVRTLPLSSLLVAAGFGSFALVDGFFGAALATVVWSFGEMLCFPAQSAFVTALAPPGKTGRAMGWYLLVFNVAFSVGPALGTRVYERFGADALWCGCLVLGVMGSMIVRKATHGVPVTGRD